MSNDPAAALRIADASTRSSTPVNGACLLRDPAVAEIGETALHGVGIEYEFFAWVIIPNHVHVLIAPIAGNRASMEIVDGQGNQLCRGQPMSRRQPSGLAAEIFRSIIWERSAFRGDARLH